MNLYQHSKNEDISSICSGDIVDLKILQSDWLRAVWQISQEPDFSHIYEFCNNFAIFKHYKFLYRINSEKINHQILHYIKQKKTLLAYLPHSWGKKTLYRFLKPCQNIEKKLKTQFQKTRTAGRMDRQKDGRKDRRTTLLSIARGSTTSA